MNNNLMSEKIDSLALALSKAQSAIENVSKDKQAYGYKYADLASCLAAIKKPLGDNGLSISQLVSQEGDKHTLITILLHESGQWLKSVFSIENVVMKQCNSLQQLGAGLTYARRYALSAIVGLTQEDDDAQSLAKERQKEELKEQITQAASFSRQFMALCHESGLEVKEFAKFAGVNSSDYASIKSAIENFESLKESFLEVSRDAA